MIRGPIEDEHLVVSWWRPLLVEASCEGNLGSVWGPVVVVLRAGVVALAESGEACGSGVGWVAAEHCLAWPVVFGVVACDAHVRVAPVAAWVGVRTRVCRPDGIGTPIGHGGGPWPARGGCDDEQPSDARVSRVPVEVANGGPSVGRGPMWTRSRAAGVSLGVDGGGRVSVRGRRGARDRSMRGDAYLLRARTTDR